MSHACVNKYIAWIDYKARHVESYRLGLVGHMADDRITEF